MVDVQYRKPTSEHLRFIADNMRPEDTAEVWAMNRCTPLEALTEGIKMSQYSVVMVADGIPAAIYGLRFQSMITGFGIPWMLATTQAMRYKRQFLELSPPVVADMMKLCVKLENYVHADNRESIRWLRWLGFTIDPAEPIGISGEMFHRFHRERGN